MTNAKEEALKEIGVKEVEYIHIKIDRGYFTAALDLKGTLNEVLSELDVCYDSGYGGQELFGHIWYKDGTWSERCEYDGSEWWEHKTKPSYDAEV